MGVLIRLLLLFVIALAAIDGNRLAADVITDQQTEPVELTGAEAVLVDPIELPPPLLSGLIPPVMHGTESDHPSPEPARVFRPPRPSFV